LDIDQNPLAQLSMTTLAFAVIVTFLTSYALAYFYRNVYDFVPVLRKFGFYSIPFFAIFGLLHVKVILLVGIYLFGFVILIFRSNNYFNQ